MQLEKGRAIRDAWLAKGNPECDHPSVDKEYYRGADTGDEVCTRCGAAAPRGILQRSQGTTVVTDQVFTQEGDFPETLS